MDQLKKSCKQGAHFVMNVSMPSFAFQDIETEEFISAKANRDFYQLLGEYSDSQLVENTVRLFDKILAGDVFVFITPM